MTELRTPTTTAEDWRRLSPRMLLVHPVTELIRALPGLLGIFLAGSSSGSGSRWSLIATGVVIALSLTRWFTTRYRITPAQVQLRHGLLRRRTIATPTDRVRTVDVTAHALHRVLGLARVVVGTGTSDRKGRDRIVLDGLSAQAAERLRGELLHYRGAAATGRAVEPSTEQEIVRLDPAWIKYAPFTLSGAITGLALLGFAWRVVTEGHVNLHRIGPLRSLGETMERTNPVLDVVAVALAATAFVAIASTVGYVLAFWNFRLTRHSGGTVHVARGLITTRATSIERRRLHGVELSEPLLLRAVGGARCLVIATGLRVGRGAERGGELLLPPAPLAMALEVAAAVLATDGGSPGPLTALFAGPLRPHGPAARRRRLVRALAAALTAVALCGLVWALAGGPGYGWVVSLVLLVGVVPLADDRYRSLGHDLIDGYLVVRSGSLVRRRCALATTAVIGWNIRATYFQRRLGLATLTATTAAGRQRYRAYDLPGPEALTLADAATPGLLTQFVADPTERARHRR